MIRGGWRAAALIAALVGAAALTPAPAVAEFPYPAPTGDPGDFTQYKVGDQTPNDLEGKLEWMYAATPADPVSPAGPLIAGNNSSPFELDGMRGASLADARLGRDGMADHDGAARRRDLGARLRDQVGRPRRDARPAPQDAASPRRAAKPPDHPHHRAGGPARDCDSNTAGACDANGDGVFNVVDYACDPRVERDAPPNGARPRRTCSTPRTS